MASPQPSDIPGFRLQGTDGIRRETKLSSHPGLHGITPQEAFLEHGLITEQFLELYAFTYLKHLAEIGEMEKGAAMVVGWDPRDKKGDFVTAVVQGLQKAGACIFVLGIVPTPLVSLFMQYKNAKSGFMITASHNPKDQNGIKIFCDYRGMKLLPENDIQFTRKILRENYRSLAPLPLKGKLFNCRKEALELFSGFSLAAENLWTHPRAEKSIFKKITIVVDPANGSLTGIAADIFREAGFGKVIEVNGKLNGSVNQLSGVEDLEGHKSIPAMMVQRGAGLFQKHQAILKLFELGRRHKTKIVKG